MKGAQSAHLLADPISLLAAHLHHFLPDGLHPMPAACSRQGRQPDRGQEQGNPRREHAFADVHVSDMRHCSCFRTHTGTRNCFRSRHRSDSPPDQPAGRKPDVAKLLQEEWMPLWEMRPCDGACSRRGPSPRTAAVSGADR